MKHATAVIDVSGGVVQAVFTDDPNLTVVLVDWDNIKAGDRGGLYATDRLDEMPDSTRQEYLNVTADPNLSLQDDGSVIVYNDPSNLLVACECDNTNEQHDTVCRWCWAHGRRKYNDPEVTLTGGP